MKTCAYCGRENDEAARQCRECGTDEFHGAAPAPAPVPPGPTEREFIARLRAAAPRDPEATLRALALADEAVRACPLSAELWVLRGDLIRTGPQPGPHPLEEALRSYQRAVEIAPQLVSSQTRAELRELTEMLGD